MAASIVAKNLKSKPKRSVLKEKPKLLDSLLVPTTSTTSVFNSTENDSLQDLHLLRVN